MPKGAGRFRSSQKSELEKVDGTGMSYLCAVVCTHGQVDVSVDVCDMGQGQVDVSVDVCAMVLNLIHLGPYFIIFVKQ